MASQLSTGGHSAFNWWPSLAPFSSVLYSHSSSTGIYPSSHNGSGEMGPLRWWFPLQQGHIPLDSMIMRWNLYRNVRRCGLISIVSLGSSMSLTFVEWPAEVSATSCLLYPVSGGKRLNSFLKVMNHDETYQTALSKSCRKYIILQCVCGFYATS